MRTIKFRAWDGEKMHRVGTIRWPFRGNDPTVVEAESRPFKSSGIWEPINEPILMQYTNLKDKNGVEIYEGDLVQSFSNINKKSDPHLSAAEPIYRTSSVEFYNGAFRLTCDEFTHGCGILNNYVGAMAEDLEVIGNIYESPELLKEEEE